MMVTMRHALSLHGTPLPISASTRSLIAIAIRRAPAAEISLEPICSRRASRIRMFD